MKLNNKGWSLNTLLICMAVILSFLIISVFYVYKLSSELSENLNPTKNSSNNTTQVIDKSNNESDKNQNTQSDANNNKDTSNNSNNQNNSTNSSQNKYYTTKESQLQAATIRYLKENAIAVADDETITINANDVISKKYMQAIKDERTNNVCDGYSRVSFKDNDYVVKSYIDCDSYSSEDYGVEE